MADPEIENKAKDSALQVIVKGMKFLLSPFTDATQKGLRTEYLDSLGLDDKDLKESETNKVDAFLSKSSDEADLLSFAAALKEQTEVVANLQDLVKRNVEKFGGEPFEKKRLVNDITTTLLNILTLEYFRLKVPTLHNIFMGLYSLNNFSNRGKGAYPIGGMIRDYAKRWKDSFHLKTADEARHLSEVFFVVGTIFAYIANTKLYKAARLDDIETTLLVGGQFGNEANRKTELVTARDFINDLLGRTFELSISKEKGNFKEEMSATFVMLSKEDGSSGVEVFIDKGFTLNNFRLSENWFFTIDISGNAHFRTGGNNTDSDVDLKSSKLAMAFEYLIFKKDILPENIRIPTFFEYFKFGFGNVSMQLEVSPRDLVLTFVTQIIYAITNKKIVAGKEEKAGFPLSLLPTITNLADVPMRLSLKDGFGFDGGFIGERPPDTAAPAAARNLSHVPAGTLAAPAADAASDSQTGIFSIPVHKELGIVRFDKVNVGFNTDKGLALDITLDFALKLGEVVVISISKLGTSLSAKKRTEEPVDGGVMGYDLKPGFVPPSGAGIVIDAKAVKGGGYLYFDDKKGEYYGSIELDVKGMFSLKAIGIIRTRDDKGKHLFSLLILITAEFKPVQLGFGFTINGVGGLLGLNRTVNVQLLQEGMTTNVLDNILFPKNVVANMNRIISDLTKVFPIAENYFLVGLMAKIGWGTPSKITADIGIILNLPDPRIVLVGVLKADFPTEKKAILKLKAAFTGILDFKNKFIYFRAELIDSRILIFRLTGTWVLGISWNDPSVFVISAGGFNPRFKEIPKLPTLPNAFKNMQRIGIQLLDTDNPRILVETYFAITSNTVQFGGKAEFLYDIAFGYNVYGRLEVHALFQFSPFHFIFDIEAEIALRDGTDWVMGIGIYGTLEGPTPWHVKATGKIKMPWYLPDIEVSLEKTWGNTVPALPAETAKVLEQMTVAIADTRNWNSSVPAGNSTHVIFRQPETGLLATESENPGKTRMAPNGILKFSQSIAPLDFTLQKFGEQLPDIPRFSIASVKIGTIDVKGNEVRDLFSPEMYLRLTTDERLSRPSFERMKSGFEVSDKTNTLQIGPTEVVLVTGEISVNSNNKFNGQTEIKNKFGQLVRTSSATYKSAASVENRLKVGGYGSLVPTVKGKYVVATTDSLKNHFDKKTFDSFAEAEEERLRQPARVQKKLQVLDNYELA